MINGKNDNFSDNLMENSENTDITDVKLEEAMDIDTNNASDNNCSNSPKMDNSLLILNQNNTNGCSVALPGVQNNDYNIKTETKLEVNNNDIVDDTGDLYAEDDEARPTGVIIHKFTNISQYKELEQGSEKKLLSEPIKIRCLPWKILVMFRVNNNVIGNDLKQRQMGIFLQCNADCDSTSWNCNAKAKITLISQRKSTGDEELIPQDTANDTENAQNSHDIVRTIEHNFYSKENDWGFSTFINLADLFNADKGYVVDDSILVQISINADAPHGIDWDSKRHTGFVGLKNQGATCYLNSLLQTLFFTNKLRKAVYMMPTYSDEPSVSVPLALQRVFYELQFSEKSVGTKKLTRSFGWETLDSFMQHDAQELCRVLMDNMENKMKGTSVENMIPSLFCGKMLSYIKCKHVPMESTREENFYDIQLKVKNNRTIYDAFEEYISVETLDADNKYDAGQYGLQEAEKGVIFVNFPPVLYLQLMRFQFDFATETNVKINDRFEFCAKLDLTKYIKDSSKSDCSVNYFLHAVLVHSGDNHGGHYVVYLNPRGDNKWYKFDDDVVSRCSAKEAIQMNFGGYEEDLGVRQCTNAYMLVYMSEQDKDDILCPVTESDIPAPLLERFAKEQMVEAQKRREKAESHLFTCVYLLLEEDFYGWRGFDLCSLTDAPTRKIRVSKSATLDELTEQVCDMLNLPPKNIRLWHMKTRKNQTNRITVLDIKDNFLKQDMVLYLWVECVPVTHWLEACQNAIESSPIKQESLTDSGSPPQSPNSYSLSSLSIESIYPFDINNDLLVFLKFYDYHTRTIHYCGHIFIRIHSQFSVVIPELINRARLQPNTELLIYEERRPVVLEPIDPNIRIEQCFESVMDGNIVVFQEKPSDSLLESSGSIDQLRVCDYFQEYCNQFDVYFVDKYQIDDNNNGFQLRISGRASYDELAKIIGNYLNYPHDRLQFFRSQFGFSNKELVGSCIKSTFDGELKDLLAHYPRNKANKRIYYEKLTMPVEELENMRQIHCYYVNEKMTEETLYNINLNRNATIKDLVISIISQVSNIRSNSPNDDEINMDNMHQRGIDNGNENELLNRPTSPEIMKYRVFEISNCKIMQQYTLDTKISQIPTGLNRHLRVEPIPIDEQELDNNERLIFVAHFHKEIYSTFGIPFALKLRDGETFSSVKERIKIRLDVSDKEFDKWRFAIISGRPTYLNDDPDSVVSINAFHSHAFSTMTGTKPWLGIEHKPTKRPRAAGCEKPIKIHN